MISFLISLARACVVPFAKALLATAILAAVYFYSQRP